MIAKVKSYVLSGIDAVPITVECEMSYGIGIHIIGLTDQQMKESLLRTVTALQARGYHIPGKKIIINILPAVKSSECTTSALDLPIALAILSASEQEAMPSLDGLLIAGELTLDAHIRHIPGGYQAGELAERLDLTAVLPNGTAGDAYLGYGKSGNVYRVESLVDAIKVAKTGKVEGLLEEHQQRDGWEEPYNTDERTPSITKKLLRGIEVAAASGFDIFFTAENPNILTPALRAFSVLSGPGPDANTMRIRSATNHKRSYSTPRMTAIPQISASTLFGGGVYIQPGYVSLCHGGTLVMQDISQWPKNLAESLRKSHEDKQVTISRLKNKVTFPTSYRIAATDETKNMAVALDKIPELRVAWINIKNDNGDTITDEDWDQARRRVKDAQEAQKRDCDALFADIPTRDLDIPLHGPLAITMDKLINAIGISARHYADIVRLASVITYLDGKQDLDAESLLEAISYIPRPPQQD